MKRPNKSNALIIGLLATACLGCSALAQAQGAAVNRRAVSPPVNTSSDVTDTRFYVAPMFSYGMFDEGTFEPDDTIGGTWVFGKTISDYVALEAFAYGLNDADVEADNRRGNIDVLGYGLSALIFPMRDIFPVFGLVGFGAGDYDFDQISGNFSPAIGDINKQDMQFVDVGIGFLVPIGDLVGLGIDMAIRGEYRYRDVDVDAEDGGQYQFRNDVISLGVQIPLGPKPQPPPPPPVMQPETITVAAPITDSDNDGVPDRNDRCPGTPPGTLTDRYGCAQEKQGPITLKGVTFEYDSARLTARAEQRLDNVVNALQAAGQVQVQIAGHTDRIASDSYNLALSQRRAQSVKTYLASHGIDASRLSTVGYGESRPKVACVDVHPRQALIDCLAPNRRVELHVVGQ